MELPWGGEDGLEPIASQGEYDFVSLFVWRLATSYSLEVSMKFTLQQVKIPELSGNNLARSQRSAEQKQRLIDSVKTYGVLQPIIVHKKGDKLIIIAGFGRVEASTCAGLTEIPAQVIEGDLKEHEILILACQENNVRESMSFMDQVDALERIVKLKRVTDTEAGRLIGLKQSVTSKIMSAKARLDDEVLLQLSQHGYGYSFAYPLSKAPPEEQKRLCELMIREKWSRQRLEDELKPDTKRTVRFEGDVTMSISFPKTATYESVKEAITKALRDISMREKQGIDINLLAQVMK
jgi:ParB/RepB/Spo0J family partition protein